MKVGPLPALLLTPFFARSLTLLPRSLLLNHTETLATQASLRPPPLYDHLVILTTIFRPKHKKHWSFCYFEDHLDHLVIYDQDFMGQQ